MEEVTMTAPGGGQTQSDPSGWTVDTLHEYFQAQLSDLRIYNEMQVSDLKEKLDERYRSQSTAMEAALAAADRAVAAALLSAEKAVTKAENAAEKRFDAVNEFRAQLADQAQSFMPRGEASILINANSDKIDSLAQRIDRAEGKGAGLNAGWVYLLAAIAAIGTLVSIYLAMSGK